MMNQQGHFESPAKTDHRWFIHRPAGEPMAQLVRVVGVRGAGKLMGYVDTEPVVNELLGVWHGHLTPVSVMDDAVSVAADFLRSLSRDPLLREQPESERARGFHLVGNPCVSLHLNGAFFRRWCVMIDGEVEACTHVRRLADAASALARTLYERIDAGGRRRPAAEGITVPRTPTPGQLEATQSRNGDRATGTLNLSGTF